MNNKEFIAELSARTGRSTKVVTTLTNLLVDTISNELVEENSVNISGFGNFEVKKKLERIVVNPSTKQRMLVPPKIVVGFKPTNTLKDKANKK